jgi:peptidoglycan/LPS O-acetylase OafA/YrhL
LRIFVPYWTFLLIIVIAQTILMVGPPWQFALHWSEMSLLTRAYLLFTNIFIVGQEWMMWLSYDRGTLTPVWSSDGLSTHVSAFFVVPQAWSMSLELMFYALAPFLVRRHWLLLMTYIGLCLSLLPARTRPISRWSVGAQSICLHRRANDNEFGHISRSDLRSNLDVVHHAVLGLLG